MRLAIEQLSTWLLNLMFQFIKLNKVIIDAWLHLILKLPQFIKKRDEVIIDTSYRLQTQTSKCGLQDCKSLFQSYDNAPSKN